MKIRRWIFAIIGILILSSAGYWTLKKFNVISKYSVGQPIDSLNGVFVYYNAGIGTIVGRNTKDGYNIGLKYQCVEFVKRYYFECLNHKMPNSYGHAKSFFNPKVTDGGENKARGLIQYTNPSKTKPKVSDLIVMGQSTFGHVAIVSKVTDNYIEIIQQNPGKFTPSRVKFNLNKTETGLWKIEKERIMGWLRKE